MIEVALLLACVAVVAIPALKQISFGVNKNVCAALVMTDEQNPTDYERGMSRFRVNPGTGEGVCRRNLTFVNPYFSSGGYF